LVVGKSQLRIADQKRREIEREERREREREQIKGAGGGDERDQR
jgi:hypothetical protein